jgi:hypothetical protein
MAEEIQKLCDECHERAAVHHVHTFYGGDAEQKRDLCVQCFARSASPEQLASLQRLQKAIRNGKCKYCGAPVVGGSSRKNLWCRQCRQDLDEFNNLPENAMPEDPGEDEAKWEQVSQQLAERQRRQDAFMRQRVRERGQSGRG